MSRNQLLGLGGLAPLVACWLLADVPYYLRALYVIVKAKWQRRSSSGPFDTTKTWGICLLGDLDHFCHMNNGRYLRECDFSRTYHYYQNRFREGTRAHGCDLVIRANTIRYRRSVLVFQTFNILTRIIYWDEKNLYIEQRLVRCSDDFICSINLTSMAVVPTRTDKAPRVHQIMESVYGELDAPDMPEDLALWVRSGELSSQVLYKQSAV